MLIQRLSGAIVEAVVSGSTAPRDDALGHAGPSGQADPHHQAAADTLRSAAITLAWYLDDASTAPSRWRALSFRRTVSRIRDQLAPIASLAALADSYGSEAVLRAGSWRGESLALTEGGPLDVAYALRWLELTGEPIPDWFATTI